MSEIPRADPARLDEPVHIAWRNPMNVDLVVAGVNVAPLCRAATLILRNDQLPQLMLTLDVLAVTAILDEADVSLDDSAARALMAMGWTPPEGKAPPVMYQFATKVPGLRKGGKR